jgi:hypothetical protein
VSHPTHLTLKVSTSTKYQLKENAKMDDDSYVATWQDPDGKWHAEVRMSDNDEVIGAGSGSTEEEAKSGASQQSFA